MNEATTRLSDAAALDAADPLARFRGNFAFPEPAIGEPVYFTGNSLGLMPLTVRDYVAEVLDDWARLAVDGHLMARHPWLPYHEFLASPLARLVGAEPDEVVAMNSLTVNLHLLLVSFYRPSARRNKIVIEKGAFPSDRYAVVSQLKFHGFDESSLIEIAPRDGESILRTEDIIAAIEDDADRIALVLFGGVNYYSGQFFDLPAITRAAHAAGAIAGFDLAHAAGNVPLRLHEWDVDFAVWCGYKYLNGGPGAVAGAFVHRRHAESFDLPRFAGWWGHDKQRRFQMEPDFRPLRGAEGWQISNPPILQMAALRASLDIFDEAGIENLRAKSELLTAFLESQIESVGGRKIEIITPRERSQRGCQLSLRINRGGRELHDRIVARGVYADWREPDVIRVAPVPLYNSFSDVARFAAILRECLDG